jgi:hypothetical protein
VAEERLRKGCEEAEERLRERRSAEENLRIG